jgi:hypothetical protein
MIDPSSSEDDSDDDQRETPVTQSTHHQRGHLHAEPQRESLDVPPKAGGSHRSLSPNSTASSDTLNVGQAGSMGSGSGTSNISAGGTPLRGTVLQRPTSPSPSLVSEKTVTDSTLDPQVCLFTSFPLQ